MKYEYMVQLWGGFFNDEYQKVHGYKEGFYWFDTENERANFIEKLLKIEKDLKACYLMRVYHDGYDTRVKTVAYMTFFYNGVEYEFRYDFGYGYDPSDARYMFEDGNYSCDCNRSLFLHAKYPQIPEMDCGNEIEMKNFQIVLELGTQNNFDQLAM